MADMNEFSLPVRLFLAAYPWRRINPVPFAASRKPLKDCRLALVSSAGLVAPGQTPFDEDFRGGDFSYREIPNDTDLSLLQEFHRSDSFDHSGLKQDPNLVLPIDRVNELVTRGRIGSVNHRHLSFMGSITAPGRLMKESAPAAARVLASDGVDVALLVPV